MPGVVVVWTRLLACVLRLEAVGVVRTGVGRAAGEDSTVRVDAGSVMIVGTKIVVACGRVRRRPVAKPAMAAAITSTTTAEGGRRRDALAPAAGALGDGSVGSRVRGGGRPNEPGSGSSRRAAAAISGGETRMSSGLIGPSAGLARAEAASSEARLPLR